VRDNLVELNGRESVRVTRPNGTDRLVEVWDGDEWVVLDYDSGWRDVLAIAPAGYLWVFRLRRRLTDVDAFFMEGGTETADSPSFDLPPGFGIEPGLYATGHFTHVFGTNHLWAFIAGEEALLRRPTVASFRASGIMRWPTTAQIPQSLPGTAVGLIRPGGPDASRPR
jgi:hypothetical protein